MHFPVILLLLHSISGGLVLVVAQPSITQEYTAPTSPRGTVNNFQPSLAVVIGILSIMFSVTFILLIYAKFCHRGSSAAHADFLRRQGGGLVRSASRFSGIEKTVIESLPFFRFSSLRGNRDGLECAVCISKFEDVEILRLLPKCKHAFHINCIDQWLERHSSCPICRSKVNADDPTIFAYSNSMRMMWSQSGRGGGGGGEGGSSTAEAGARGEELGLFIEREESGRRSSSRFGGSFRKLGKSGRREEEDLMQEAPILEEEDEEIGGNTNYHKFNHRIVVSDVVFKNRWSSVTSSDLMFLSSEMLIDVSGERLGKSNGASPAAGEMPSTSSDINCSREIANSPADRRSVSEMSGVSRLRSMEWAAGAAGSNGEEERRRRLWFPIARRTAEWFVNRERRSIAESRCVV
ncbi:Putative RING-H2 finger protein ATL12 [Linum grandiflorum]